MESVTSVSRNKYDRIVQRESGIELFRIVLMLVIVSHHYVVNSGLSTLISENATLTSNIIFLLLFGWGGKTAINCFVLITGYFMCESNITVRKFIKLLLQVEFYKITIYLIFLLTGYESYSIKGLLKSITPFYSIGSGFTSSYLIFFLFIPFLNILIHGMDKKIHLKLIGLCVLVFTILPSFILAKVTFSYVFWFIIIYLIAAYIRLYPENWFYSLKVWGIMMLVSLGLSWCSVIAIAWLGKLLHINGYQYFFVADSNKILALVTAVCAFMYFKNLHVNYNKFINTIAASTFGVLLIHANSDTMRTWLWRDTLNNVHYFDSSLLVFHAVCSVAAIYVICTFIDMLRIRFLEKPFFRLYDKKLGQGLWNYKRIFTWLHNGG